MEISKANRRNNKVNIDGKEFDVDFLNQASNTEVQGYLINQDNGDLFFIDNTNYFLELKTTLKAFKEFLNVFASNKPIGSNGGGVVLPDPALVKSATKINIEIDKLIKKIP